jgi:hypothetical protein
MMSTAERMKLSERILSLIDRKRVESGDPNVGLSIERELLSKHLQELEHDILEDPGAMEPWLVRRRQS